jgi:hypothetical protein
MNRKEFLDAAAKTICQDRQDVHGNPESCFSLIAGYWTKYLTQKQSEHVYVSPQDVAVMMTLFKIARWQMNQNHDDNIIDGIGYFALAGELKSGDVFKNNQS